MMDLLKIFSKKPASKDIARDRLKLVLSYDRVNCSPQLLEMLKIDIIKVISNYVEIDEQNSDIQISQVNPDSSDSAPVLCANIAIKSMRKVRT